MPGQSSNPRGERLRSRRDYLEVYREGKKAYGGPFICYVAQREGQGRRFGMAVPKRVGGAVVRNRVKRYLRETYRLNRSRLVDDVWIVVVARDGAGRMSYPECAEAIIRLFRKGGVLSE